MNAFSAPLLIFSLFFIFPRCYAQEQAETLFFPPGLEKQLKKKITDLAHIKPDKFPSVYYQARDELLEMIEKKKAVCNGEFDVFVFDKIKTENSLSLDKGKLSYKQRKQCHEQVKEHLSHYLKALFQAREKYLIYFSQVRLEELKKAGKDSLSSFE